MKTRSQSRRRRQGSLQIDLVIALSIVVIALLPLASSIRAERQLCRALYYRAVAMSIVDGEAEILQAGEWQDYEPGIHDYEVRAEAANNLPEGRFVLNRTEQSVHLSWKPRSRGHGGRVERNFSIPITP